jgi:hypothetical protein
MGIEPPQNPVEAPAALAGLGHGIDGRLARPVTVGVGVEHRLQDRLQTALGDLLGDTIGDRRCQSDWNFDPGPDCNLDPGLMRVLWLASRVCPKSWQHVGILGAERWGVACCDQRRFLKRQLSLPVSTMSQWWVRRSSSAVVIFGSPNTEAHSANARLVVTMIEVRS